MTHLIRHHSSQYLLSCSITNPPILDTSGAAQPQAKSDQKKIILNKAKGSIINTSKQTKTTFKFKTLPWICLIRTQNICMFPLRELRFSLGEGSGHPNPNATVLDLPNQEKPMCAYNTGIVVIPKIKTHIQSLWG